MINYSIRPVMWEHKKNASGLCPIMIRVTIGRKNTYFKTDYKLQIDQWDAGKKEIKNHDNAKVFNVALRKKIAELEKDISIKQIEGRELTVKTLRGITGDRRFAHFAREVRYVNKEINRVEAFMPEVMLSQMNVQFLRRYLDHELSRGMSINTTNTTFKYLRRIIRQAYFEKIITENPFDHFKVPKYTNPETVYLTLTDIDKIEKWIKKKTVPRNLYLVAVYFLFGCYTGLRYSDWVRFDQKTNVREGRIILRAKKNKKDISMKIYSRLQVVLDRMKTLDKPFENAVMNRLLKDVGILSGIKTPLRCHVSRHTFGTLMATKGVSMETAGELMGIDIKTVKVYYKVTGEKVDKETEMLDRM